VGPGGYAFKNVVTNKSEPKSIFPLENTPESVISKGKIDFGSDLLVTTFLKAYPPGPTKKIIDVGCGYGTRRICFQKCCH
jgi:16S rRNA G1207 methylase RsmC